MYSLKFAHLVREKLPDAECYEFYIDMRAFGKGYEEFFERIRRGGHLVVRGRSARSRPTATTASSWSSRARTSSAIA
jgi:heterodisulfide reductase subunit A2